MSYSYYVDVGLVVTYILVVMLCFVRVAVTENFALLGGMVCCCFLKVTGYCGCITVLLRNKSAG